MGALFGRKDAFIFLSVSVCLATACAALSDIVCFFVPIQQQHLREVWRTLAAHTSM